MTAPDGGLLGALADFAPESLTVRDASGLITLWNDRSHSLYGISAEAALGLPLNALLQTRHPFGLAAIEEELEKAGSWSGEVYRTAAGGREVRVEVHWRLRRDASGSIIDILERGIDRSSDEEARLHAQVTAHRYNNLFHAMAASFWEMDFSEVRNKIGSLVASGVTDLRAHFTAHPEFIDECIAATRIIDVNETTVDVFGAPSREAILNLPLGWEWPQTSRPVYAEALIAAAERRDRFMTEVQLRRWDGTLLDALFTVCWPNDHKGRGTVLVGVIDISDRKAMERDLRSSEERYRNLFEFLPIAVWRMDGSAMKAKLKSLREAGETSLLPYAAANPDFKAGDFLTVVEVNQATLKLFGLETKEQAIGPLSRFWATHEAAVTISDQRMRGKKYVQSEARLLRADGSEFDALVTVGFPDALADESVNLVAALDISDRKRAEHRLQRVQADFSHAARVSTLGELAASIAHEVNQPLAAIAAYAQASLRWLKRDTPDMDELRTLSEQVVEDARRASDIIVRIRAMAMKRDPTYLPLDLNDLVEEALLIVRHEAATQEVKLVTRLSPELPRAVGDRVQLQQVIVNLALNAAQAMAAAEGGLRVLTVSTSFEDGMLVVSVADTGPGISADDLDRLFTGFFTTKEQGMGMGLAICRSIIEAHGGFINASNQTSGACFRFTLPPAATQQ